MNIVSILTIFQVFTLTDSYEFACPSKAHWNLRAKSMCTTQRNYSCLFDVNLQINVYRDKCIRPRILGPGYRYVFQPNPNRDICSLSRYQPFIFNTTGNSDCAFLKSLCNSEGQQSHTDDTTRSDRTCVCNTDNNFIFVDNPHNRCFCNPATEDCSCYLGINTSNTSIGLTDVRCLAAINTGTNRSHTDAFYRSQAVKNKDFDNFKYNLACPTNKYRHKAATYGLVLSLAYTILLGIYGVLRLIRRLMITPKGFDIVESTDRSITVKLSIDDKDNCLDYQLVHRRTDSHKWKNTTPEDVSPPRNKCRLYKLDNLKPATDYELKMRSIDNHLKSPYTEFKTKKTKKVAPQNLDILEWSDQSITITWDFIPSNNCQNYELKYMCTGEHEWKSLQISNKDVSMDNNNKRCKYTIERLFPYTSYDVKMCYIGNEENSQFTKSKSKQTLKIAPQGFGISDYTDNSITIKWKLWNSDNCQQYTLDYKSFNGDWKVATFSNSEEGENEIRLYKLKNLDPETVYELKMCSVDSTVKSQYTESETQLTRKIAPQNFIIDGFTDCSITVKWNIAGSDNILAYTIYYRRQDSTEWSKNIISSNDNSKKKEGYRLYTIENLDPDTNYELKVCSVDKDIDSQFTESIIAKTHNIEAPAQFEIHGYSDCSITVQWRESDSGNCIGYDLAYRLHNSDDSKIMTVHIQNRQMQVKQYVHKIDNLLSERFYELQICCVTKNNGNSLYTDWKKQCTRKHAPKKFSVVKSSDTSCTIKWKSLKDSEDRLQYEFEYRAKGKDSNTVFPISVNDIDKHKDKCCSYELDGLSSEECYEVRMCFVDNDVKSQYTEYREIREIETDANEDNTVATEHGDDNEIFILLPYKVMKRNNNMINGKDQFLQNRNLINNLMKQKLVKSSLGANEELADENDKPRDEQTHIILQKSYHDNGLLVTVAKNVIAVVKDDFSGKEDRKEEDG